MCIRDRFHDYWEDVLEHSPEFASTIGDKRWNDKISDYSVKAINEGLEREQNFLMKLAAIDPAGLSGEDVYKRQASVRLFRHVKSSSFQRASGVPISPPELPLSARMMP